MKAMALPPFSLVRKLTRFVREAMQRFVDLRVHHDVRVCILPRSSLLSVLFDDLLGFVGVERKIERPEELPLRDV